MLHTRSGSHMNPAIPPQISPSFDSFRPGADDVVGAGVEEVGVAETVAVGGADAVVVGVGTDVGVAVTVGVAVGAVLVGAPSVPGGSWTLPHADVDAATATTRRRARIRMARTLSRYRVENQPPRRSGHQEDLG